MTPERNRLVDALPFTDREALLGVCSTANLEGGQSLYAPGRRISRVYFPTSTSVSVQSPLPDSGLEILMVGFEGALGAQIVLGDGTASLPSIVQHRGDALCVQADDFRAQFERSPALRAMVGAYVAVNVEQLALLCGCIHEHLLDSRVACRLLMTHDCARRGNFHITHELLASVLGVRRVGVTNAASDLQRQGLIAYTRGEVTVLDRAGLESVACGCYAASRRAYALGMKRAFARRGRPAVGGPIRRR